MVDERDRALFVISVAAELADMHPQTLRQYDRLGIVQPSRAPGRARRYSRRDIDKLLQVQRLSHEGISLEGIKRILELENQVSALRSRLSEISQERDELAEKLEESRSTWAATADGEIVRLPPGTRRLPGLGRGRSPRRTGSAVVVYQQPHQRQEG